MHHPTPRCLHRPHSHHLRSQPDLQHPHCISPHSSWGLRSCYMFICRHPSHNHSAYSHTPYHTHIHQERWCRLLFHRDWLQHPIFKPPSVLQWVILLAKHVLCCEECSFAVVIRSIWRRG